MLSVEVKIFLMVIVATLNISFSKMILSHHVNIMIFGTCLSTEIARLKWQLAKLDELRGRAISKTIRR